jgi:uncharacterized protein YcbX
MSTITVGQLNIYPIKSLGGISVESAEMQARGLQYDRRWMLVDENNRFVTQRENPMLALISVALTPDGLNVSAKCVSTLHIPFRLESDQRIDVTIWKSVCGANLVSKEADDWFTEYMNCRVSLVYMPDTSIRPTKLQVQPDNIVSFADGYPMLVVGESTLIELNSRLEVPLPMNRFRPNIVLKGSEAWEEDSWNEISIGGKRVHLVSNCGRCVVTTTDQVTGERGVEPLRTLATYRLIDQKIMFGCNAIAGDFGQVTVGDNVVPHFPTNV